jgi:hypothetical protein
VQPSRLVGRLGWWSLAALALVAVVQVPAQASAAAPSSAAAGLGGIGVRLLDAPSNASDDPRAQLYVVDHLPPGSVDSRRIEVTNTTQAPVSVSLYAAAATIDGGSFVGESGHTANDLSTWSSVLPATVQLPPHGGATVTVTIAVPQDAAAGERYAVVWAEARSGAKPGIVQVNRVGIRLYVSVGPGAAPAADFTIESLTAQRSPDGLPTVVATVHNTGGRALDMAGSLELLDGPGGLRAGPFPATLGATLAIGVIGHVMIALDERVPDGPWNAELTLHSGLLERSAKASITFPRSGSAAPVPAPAVGAGWLLAAVAGFVFVLLCTVVAIVVRRRRRR